MLTLNHLSAGYHGQNVIHDISLSLEPGQIYTVVGKNGCGKSTLLKTCAGLIAPSSGSIVLDGKHLAEYTPLMRARRLSYLSQSQNRPNLTAERLVAHGRSPYLGYTQKMSRSDRDAVDQALGVMQLNDLRHRYLTELSGGECQRVYLAMLLAQDTPILLLDEPNTYMDIEYQLSFLEQLTGLKQGGKTVVMVLHDLEQALHYSDRIIALESGRVVQIGTPDEMIHQNTLSEIFRVQLEHHPYPFHPLG